MRKLTRKSLDELAKIYPVIPAAEQSWYIAGLNSGISPTGIYKEPYDDYSFAGMSKGHIMGNGGILSNFQVSGYCKQDGDKLTVSVSSINPGNLSLTGLVEVISNGQIVSTSKCVLSKSGYVYDPSSYKPLGEAYVILPSSSSYEVRVTVSGRYTSAEGRAAVNYRTTLKGTEVTTTGIYR